MLFQGISFQECGFFLFVVSFKCAMHYRPGLGEEKNKDGHMSLK